MSEFEDWGERPPPRWNAWHYEIITASVDSGGSHDKMLEHAGLEGLELVSVVPIPRRDD